MVDLLLERGKVRVNVIDSWHFLDKQFNLANCKNKSPMGIFCAMFLDKGKHTGVSNRNMEQHLELDAATYPHMDLSLEHLKIFEPHKNIGLIFGYLICFINKFAFQNEILKES